MMKKTDLISDHMRRQNELLHAAPEGFGGSGHKHADAVIAFATELAARTLLDYGCGENTLRKKLVEKEWPGRIREYDPARKKYATMPPPCDLVVCTDVLEHVEPKRLKNVLAHLHQLTLRGCYLAIATRPANKLLPSGDNAHLIIQDAEWWKAQVMKLQWSGGYRMKDVRKGNGDPHEVRFWLVR